VRFPYAAGMIRYAKPSDHPAIRNVVAAAFERTDEADLVERLRADGDAMFELVDIDGESLVGHILFSRMWADSLNLYAALAPVSVRPDLQRSGNRRTADPRRPGRRKGIRRRSGHRPGSPGLLSEVRVQHRGVEETEVRLLRIAKLHGHRH